MAVVSAPWAVYIEVRGGDAAGEAARWFSSVAQSPVMKIIDAPLHDGMSRSRTCFNPEM